MFGYRFLDKAGGAPSTKGGGDQEGSQTKAGTNNLASGLSLQGTCEPSWTSWSVLSSQCWLDPKVCPTQKHHGQRGVSSIQEL